MVKIALGAILVTAFVLRIVYLGVGDATTDEALYSFRAIGIMDFDEAEDQTTPLEWFDAHGIPWWTHISFHDHPPLVFLIQNVSMRIFGETPFGFRLPSAFLGIASVYLVFLLGRLLFSERAGIVTAAVLAVATNHVYISRIGLQESYVIFFILLALYFFLRGLQKPKYLIVFGAAFGLGFLTKYITFVVVPIALSIALIFRRDIFRKRELWIGALATIILFSPVIIYNVELYRARGHFDFQFSYIFRQFPEVWRIAPGKDIGTFSERVINFFPTLAEVNSPLFLMLAGVALLLLLWRMRTGLTFGFGVLAVSIGFVLLLLLFIGPSYRFLALLTPFFALLVGVAFELFFVRRSIFALGSILLIIEALYAANTFIVNVPYGQAPYAYAKTRAELEHYGYRELGEYFEQELAGKMPEQVFYMRYKFLDRMHDRAIERAQKQGLQPHSAIIVYDGNIQNIAQLWTFDRLNIYHAWPVVKTEQYADYLRENNLQDNFKYHYFVRATDKTLMRKPENRTIVAARFEEELKRRGVIPKSILNARGDVVFLVYSY